MTARPEGRNKALHAGWILVSGLLLLCVAGTWATWRNYSGRVFSSANGVVLEPEWPESRLAVRFPEGAAVLIRPGQTARITVGKDPRTLRGEVVSVKPASDASAVVIRLLDEPGEVAGSATGKSKQGSHWLPTGTRCAVTIDTTVPADGGSVPVGEEGKAPK
jgi:hypothetical protein